MSLMYAGATIAVVNGFLDDVTRTVGDYSQTSTSTTATVTPPVFHPFASLVQGIIVGIIVGGLWLWMAWKTGAGRNWARVLCSVFFGFACLQLTWTIFTLTRPGDTVPSFIVSLVEWGVGLATLIQLRQRESSEFFASAKQAELANGYSAA